MADRGDIELPNETNKRETRNVELDVARRAIAGDKSAQRWTKENRRNKRLWKEGREPPSERRLSKSRGKTRR